MTEQNVGHFARIGAELGFRTAATLRTMPNRAARRYHEALVRQEIDKGYRDIASVDGAGDLARLYREGFEQGLKGGQLGLPVKILMPDGGEMVVTP